MLELILWSGIIALTLLYIYAQRRYLLKGGTCPTCGKWRNL